MIAAKPATNEPFADGNDVAASIRDNFRRNLSEILEDLKSRGVTQRAIAKDIGVDPAVISFWKNGDRFPEPGYIDRIIEITGVAPEDLFRGPGVFRGNARGEPPTAWLEALRRLADLAGYDLVAKA